MYRITPAVRAILMLNALVFFASMFSGGKDFSYCYGVNDFRGMDFLSGTLSLWNIKSTCFQPYQLFTYMFVHGGFMHIFFNMMALAFMGPILETFWGSKKFTLFYMITGIGAAVFNILVDVTFNVGGFGVMLGASGAVYGVIMGFGMLFPNMEVMLLLPPIPIKAKYLVWILGVMNFILDRTGGTAHFAHLGGVVVAFILIKIWRQQGRGY